MNNELKLEYYLSQLDRALWALPVSQRSEIITEIKSHLRETMERDPSKPMETILADMGTAQDVANKYLSARGVQIASGPNKAGTFLKYLVYGTLGFFGFIIASVFLAIWYFSPLIKVDSKTQRVAFLGGTIDIDQNSLDKIKVGDIDISNLDRDAEGSISSGAQTVQPGIRQINIPFNTAKINIAMSEGALLSWNCKASVNKTAKAVSEASIMTLNLEVLNFAKCELEVPKNVALQIKGVNGKVSIDEIRSPMTLDLVNGKVDISTDEDQEYDFDVNVKNGMADKFERSLNPKAIKMRVSVVNGMISNKN